MTKTKIFTLLLAMMLCVGMLAACADTSSGSNTENTTDNKNESTSGSDSTEGTEEFEDIIGFVTAVDSDKLTVNKYTAAADVSNYAALDITTLTKTEDTETVTADADAEYFKIAEGALVKTTAEDLKAGTMIAVTQSEEGTMQIVILAVQAEREADVLGKVTFVGADYLMITVYTSENEITDYATLDTATLVAADSAAYVSLSDDIQYLTVSEGALVDAAAADLAKDCMIAVTADEEGKAQIIILPVAETPEA